MVSEPLLQIAQTSVDITGTVLVVLAAVSSWSAREPAGRRTQTNPGPHRAIYTAFASLGVTEAVSDGSGLIAIGLYTRFVAPLYSFWRR